MNTGAPVLLAVLKDGALVRLALTLVFLFMSLGATILDLVVLLISVLFEICFLSAFGLLSGRGAICVTTRHWWP